MVSNDDIKIYVLYVPMHFGAVGKLSKLNISICYVRSGLRQMFLIARRSSFWLQAVHNSGIEKAADECVILRIIF